MSYSPPPKETNLDVLQITDANCVQYIERIKSYKEQAIFT